MLEFIYISENQKINILQLNASLCEKHVYKNPEINILDQMQGTFSSKRNRNKWLDICKLARYKSRKRT